MATGRTLRSSAETWATRVARHLIAGAARAMPAPLADRLEEEWLAHLEALDGRVTRVWFAVGCYGAALAIGRDGWKTQRRAAPASGAGRGFSTTLCPSLGAGAKAGAPLSLGMGPVPGARAAFGPGPEEPYIGAGSCSYAMVATLLAGLVFGFVVAVGARSFGI